MYDINPFFVSEVFSAYKERIFCVFQVVLLFFSIRRMMFAGML